jgi:hypothetical protein
MKRELHACRTVIEHRVWSAKWGEHLSGRAARQKIEAMKPACPAVGPLRVAAGDRANFR